jgi:hypothetical protein
VLSVVDCGGSEAACEVRLTVDAVVMGVVDMLPVAATSPTRICTKTTRVQTNRRRLVDTVEHMMAVTLGVIVVMGREAMR